MANIKSLARSRKKFKKRGEENEMDMGNEREKRKKKNKQSSVRITPSSKATRFDLSPIVMDPKIHIFPWQG